jgi:hypothetical protein
MNDASSLENSHRVYNIRILKNAFELGFKSTLAIT